MDKTITVRYAGKSITEDIRVDESYSFHSFIDKVKSVGNIENDRNIKIMTNGKILTESNYESLMHEKTNTKITCLVIIGDVRQNNDVSNTTSNTTSNITSNINTTSNTTSGYTYDEVKSVILAFLNFIRVNPQTRELYANDFGQLVTEILHNPIMDKIIKDMLLQSNEIIHAMKTGGNITLHVGEKGDTNKISLLPEDREKIDEIVKLGFDPEKVVVSYIKNNKNVENTINDLLGE